MAGYKKGILISYQSRSVTFLVNVSPPKPLQVHRSYDVEDTGQHFVFVLDLRSRLKVK